MTASAPEVGAALAARVRRRLVEASDAVGRGAAGAAISVAPAEVVAAVRAESPLAARQILGAARTVTDELVGLGPLQQLLADSSVTDVLVTAPDGVWIDRGDGAERTDVRFAHEREVRRLALRLALAVGRRLDDAQPCVDAVLSSGIRLHAVIPPLCDTTQISLRVPRQRALTLEELVTLGSCPPSLAALLAAVVRARLAFLVSGGTGTGKTTVLGALLAAADPGDRVLVVEDVAELRPPLPHVVSLRTRPANCEGAGRVDTRDLVRQALRMRPDRVVVGEVRGPEVVDLLAALNTGHEGGCGTVHANAAATVPARLEALAAGAGHAPAWVRSQIRAGLDMIVHLQRDRNGRRVAEVSVFGGTLEAPAVVPALVFDGRRMTSGPGLDDLQERLARRAVKWSA